MKPKRIIVIRHGESQGNVDLSVYKSVPDHKVTLTEKGKQEAREAGKQIQEIIGDESVCFHISPYERTRQTFRYIKESLQLNRCCCKEEPRIREQEWMNPYFHKLFGDMDLDDIWQQRDEYSTFFFRLPGGESGADVYDRITTFLETLHRDFKKEDYSNVIVVTHGLAMRLFLMRWFHWSVEDFEELRNPQNCEFVIMELRNDGKYDLVTPLKKRSEDENV